MATTVKILLRNNRTSDLEYHTAVANSIPPDETCILYIGGNGTIDTFEGPGEKKASGDAKHIRNEIVKPFFADTLGIDIPVYAVKYDFDAEDGGGARTLNTALSSVANDNVLNLIGNKSKQYIGFNHRNMKREFRRYVMPWISTDGNKISVDEIEYRTRFNRISFETPNDSDMFFDLLRQNLSELSYNDSEIDLVLQYFSRIVIDMHTEHIDSLFNSVLLGRISENGKRLPINDVIVRIRKITFIAHCYGAFVVQKLQEKMKSEMQKLGYSDKEIQMVLNQMLVVAHAPSCRLDKQTPGFIGFMSAFDDQAETPNNWMRAYIRKNARQDERTMSQDKVIDMEHTWMPRASDSGQMRAAFLPRNYGNMFIIPRGFDYNIEENAPNEGEHGNTHYIQMHKQNMHGLMLNQIARNIIVNGIRNSLAQTDDFIPLPDVSELILSPTDNPKENALLVNIFDQMQKNGKTLIKNIYQYATEKLKARVPHRTNTKNHKR